MRASAPLLGTIFLLCAPWVTGVRGVPGVLGVPGVQGTLLAQSTDLRPLWFADLRYERDAFRGGSPVWTDWWAARGTLYRELGRGTLGIGGSLERRFGRADESVTVDAYHDLWTGAYGNVRLRAAPGAEVLPLSDVRGEIFQAFGGPWEGSAHLWHLNAGGPDVTLGGLGLARYAGAWYVRAIGSLASSGGRETGSGRLAARRFLGGSREYLEISAGGGGEVVTVGPGPELDVRDTWFAQITAQRYFWILGRPAEDPEVGSPRRVGVQVTGGLHDFEGIPRRIRFGLGMIASF